LSVVGNAAAAELTYGGSIPSFHRSIEIYRALPARSIVKSLGGGIEYRYDNFSSRGELSNI